MHRFFITVLILLAVGTWITTKDLFIPSFLSFIAFGVWVSRDSRRLAANDNKPLSAEEKQRIRSTFLRPPSTILPALAIVLMGYIAALVDITNPSFPPFSGRLRYIEAILFGNFGIYGMPIFWVILGTVGGFLTWTYKK